MKNLRLIYSLSRAMLKWVCSWTISDLYFCLALNVLKIDFSEFRTKEYIEWQRPLVKSAQAGGGGGCTSSPFHSIYHHKQSCGVLFLLRGQIHSPYFSSTPKCMYSVVGTIHRIEPETGPWGEWEKGKGRGGRRGTESIEWIIEEQAFSLSYDLAPPPSPPPFSRQQVVSLSQSSCVSSFEFEREGGWWGRSQSTKL